MRKITVLGAGMVGRAIARDLAVSNQVLSADISSDNLDKIRGCSNLTVIQIDLSIDKNIISVIQDADIVVNAVPGFMGNAALRTVIENSKDVVDIAFSPEDPFLLDDLAKQKNVIVVTDCGVAPGISNMVLGYHNKNMKVDTFDCLVGGLPLKRTWPFQYKAPFSPIDVLEEYTRPARYKENNCIVTRPALSDPEYVDFPEIGTLESFNSDGLRTLLDTIDIPDMKEKTLRYPGHIQIMQILRDTGFFSSDELQIKDKMIKPIDVTSEILFRSWKLGDDEEEFTVMKITVEGIENNLPVKHIYNLLDRYDPATGVSSMARTTGFACTAVVDLILKKKFTRIGICPPEFVGEEGDCFKDVFSYMKKRKIIYTHELIKEEN
jgi:saccharopine dehydrogenase-like NADP-dependent oxidoreductase